jgi:cephalosporin-C deacetylase-like acetyl esterase
MKKPQINRIKECIYEKTGQSAEQMVTARYQKIGHELALQREKIRRDISTIAAWHEERERIRKNFLIAIGGNWPRENVKICCNDEIHRKNLIIRKLLFSPFGNDWVSANLYLPRNHPAKLPAVILPHGHDMAGKNSLRERAVLFASNGYAALTFDYIGGGERNLLDRDRNILSFAGTQHNIIGNRMNLYAHNLQWFMLAETIAAIDVVSAQPEIDADRIAMTGSSGGGTETFFAAALDIRIKVLAPAACIRSDFAELNVDDAEQVFFNPIPAGLDYPDIAAFLIAPRPMTIVTNRKDIWSFDQVEYFITEVKAFYKLLGADGNFTWTVEDRGHEYRSDQQENVLKWFNLHLANNAGFVPAAKIDRGDIPDESECMVTDTGNLFLAGYPTPMKLFNEYAAAAYSTQLSTDEALKIFIDSITAEMGSACIPEWELADSYQIGNISGKRILFHPEEDIWLPAEILIPDKIDGIAILLDELPRMSDPEEQLEFARRNILTVWPDMRGFGDTAGRDTWPDRENWMQQVYRGKRSQLASLAWIAGKNLLLDRARDITALINVLSTMGHKQNIMIHGKRCGAIVALFAALMDHRITQLQLENSLNSYRALLTEEIPFFWGDEIFYGILKYGIDLPELKDYLRSFEVKIGEFNNY